MLAIRASRAFDGERLIGGGVVLLIEGSKIIGLESDRGQLPEATVVVDHGDATVLPGLIDTHVHLCGDSLNGALDRLEAYDVDQLTAVIETALQQQLAVGVTTVRDLGDRKYAVVAHRDSGGKSARPTIVASGPPITSVRGHCWNMGGEATGSEGLRAAIRERVERGVDVVKIMASGGIFTPGTDVTVPQFTGDELRLVVAEAHAAGLPITAHAHALAAVEQALSAGVDGIEHCTCMTSTGAGVSPELAERIAAAQVVVSPTHGFAPDVPPPPPVRELMERLGMTREHLAVYTRRLVEAGVQIVCGSDAGIGTGKPHGIALQALVELAGCMPAADALASATSVAARVCSLGATKGRLRSGYDADVLVVDGNPLVDMADIRRTRQVLVAGVPVGG